MYKNTGPRNTRAYTPAKQRLQDYPMHLLLDIVGEDESDNTKKIITNFARTTQATADPDFCSKLSMHFARKFPAIKSGSKYNLRDTLKGLDEFDRVCFFLATTKFKGELLGGSQESQPNNCALVPTIFSGYKQLESIGYEQWDSESLELGFSSTLQDSFFEKDLDKYTESLEGLCLLRGWPTGNRFEMLRTIKANLARTVKGEPCLIGTFFNRKDAGYYFSRVELQYWCASPDKRTPLMILDPFAFDNMPEPLETVETLFHTPEAPARRRKLPW